MTNYDRKMEARKAATQKAKKDKNVALVIAIVAVVIIIGAVVWAKVAAPIREKAAAKETYCKIGSHEVSKVEYDYFYYTTVNEYINMYGSFLQYMGLDTTQDFDDQMYDENKTWKDAFDDMTTGRIQAVFAYYDDAVKNGFTYDEATAYESYKNGIEDAAKTANYSVADYYKGMFGKYATEEGLENVVKTTLMADAYMDKLTEDNAPSAEKIESYYAEHKDDYDKVSFYAVTVEDEGDEPSFANAKEKAEGINTIVSEGGDFDTTASAVVPFPEGTSSYLSTDLAKSYINSKYSDWLFDAARVKGDVTLVEDEENNRCYVVQFEERKQSDDYADSIKSKLSSEAVSEYMKPIFDQYEITDVKGDLKFLLIDEDEESEEATDAEESDEE
ncbi:MAG: hypothetical protein K5858_06545 [Lachnospiraceae bacterium]|nr:hypothetical protein [Lachnospiraceae bacterium]